MIKAITDKKEKEDHQQQNISLERRKSGWRLPVRKGIVGRIAVVAVSSLS